MINQKILITGDVSNKNIGDFDIKKVNKEVIHKIKTSDFVIYNLEGPISKSKEFSMKNHLQFRECKVKNSFFHLLNKINKKIRNKPQIKVYSTNKIFSLLKINK